MKRLAVNVSIALLAVFAGLQLVHPEMANPPVDPQKSLWNDHQVDPRVGQILRRACADCHSHETVWPWYAKISPVSWYLRRHVVEGRAKLNFSDWSGPSQDQLEEIYDSIAKNKMPMSSYVILHPDAKLSKGDRNILTAWADGKLVAQNR